MRNQVEEKQTPAFLRAEDLSCERDGRLLFEGLNLSLLPGDMLQVSGPNGSGKTSLLRLLAGLMPPSAGDICMSGLQEGVAAAEGPSILWIGHATGIKTLMTAEENLHWLCALHQQPASSSQIWAALAAVGLRGFEDVPCHTLSAGQQRRVALARLYLDAPLLWILDEPFTALDRQGVAQLEQHLAQHCESGGLVVFTTHHNLSARPAGFRELDLGQRAVA